MELLKFKFKLKERKTKQRSSPTPDRDYPTAHQCVTMMLAAVLITSTSLHLPQLKFPVTSSPFCSGGRMLAKEMLGMSWNINGPSSKALCYCIQSEFTYWVGLSSNNHRTHITVIKGNG